MDQFDRRVLGDAYRLLEEKSRVRVNLSDLTVDELFKLDAGIASEFERRNRREDSNRVWEVPGQAVKVFIEQGNPTDTRERRPARRSRKLHVL